VSSQSLSWPMTEVKLEMFNGCYKKFFTQTIEVFYSRPDIVAMIKHLVSVFAACWNCYLCTSIFIQ
jgi:hypothetical protein